MAVTIFFVDLALPLGIAAGVPYVTVILLGWWFNRSHHVFLLATACSLLTILGYFYSPTNAETWIVLTNRAIAVCAIWLTAALVVMANKAAKQAHRTADHLTAVMNSAATGIVTIDAACKITSFNPAAEKLFGYRAADMISENVSMLMPEPYHGAHDDYVSSYLAGGAPKVIGKSRQVSGLRRDGAVFPMELSISETRSGGARHFVGFITDMTERVEAEEALRESEARLRAVMDNSPTEIYIKDDQGRYLEVNRRYEELWGVKNDEIRGKLPSDVHRSNLISETVRSQDLAVLESGRAIEGENEFPFDDGLHTFHMIKYPLRDSSGRVFGLGGMAADVTERKRVEEALRKQEKGIRLLHKITAAANEATEVKAALQACLDEVCAYTSWPVGHVFCFDEMESGELTSAALWHLDDPDRFATFQRISETIRFAPGVGLPGRVLASGNPAWIDDVTKDPNFPRAKMANDLGVKAGFAFPVLAGQEVLAVLEFFSREAVTPDESILEIMAQVGTQLGRVMERKHARDALAEKTALLDGLISNAPANIAIRDTDGRYILVNAQYAAAYGDSCEYFLGKTLHDLFPKDIAEEFDRYDRRILNSHKRSVHELDSMHADGSVHTYLTSRFPILNAAEAPVAMALIDVDISERRQAEEALRESERRYRDIFENAVEGIYKTAPDGRYLAVNPALARMHGCDSPEEFLYYFPNATLVYVDPEAREALTGKMRDGGFLYGFECEARKLDGGNFWMSESGHSVRDEDGKLLGYEGFVEDISERKSMRDTAEQLGSILDRSWNEIYVFDAESLCFIRANEAARRNLGYSAEELRELTPVDLKPQYSAEEFARLIAPLRDGDKEQIVFETVHRRKDGTDYPVEVGLQISRFESPPVFVSVVLDISQRKETEEQLRHAQRMEAMGRLTGGVAHEFNNQLLAIGGFARLLQRARVDPETERTWIENIVTATEQASSLTDQLLSFGRKQGMAPKVLGVGTAIQAAQFLLRPMVDGAVVLKSDLNDEEDRIKVDPGAFSQALLNLAINACDAMPDGGTLTLSSRTVRLDGDALVGFADAQPGTYVAVSVSDTGTGIDEEVLKHVFEPFFTTKEGSKGTGLGLSMVYGMVRQCGGKIAVDSRPGAGTTFTIYLPRVEEAVAAYEGAPAAHAAPAVPATTAGSGTVLVAEDEATVRELLKASLEGLGYRVLVARDGLSAQRIFHERKGHIDLLLTDMVMPGLSGRQLARNLVDVQPDLKVLYTTGYDPSGDDEEDSSISEQETIIRKPFDPRDLGRIVHGVLNS